MVHLGTFLPDAVAHNPDCVQVQGIHLDQAEAAQYETSCHVVYQ